MSRSVGCRARVALSLPLFGFLIFNVACSTSSTSSPASAPAPPATGQPASAVPTSAPAPVGGSSAPATAPAGSAPTGAGAASPSPAVVGEATAKAGIQQSLDARIRAIQAKDDKAYMALIDQENLTWKRVQSEIFRQYVEGIGGIQRNARVTAVRHHRASYYKATIDVGAGEKSQQVWIFTPVDGKWLHTEPLEQELGERRTKETEHFKIRYYEWDNEILDRMIAVSERAHATVTKTLNKTPETKTTVYVSPTFQTHPGRGSHSQAAFFNPDVKDAVYIRSLDSFGSRPPAGLTQEDELLWSLTHEYVHLVNNLIVRIVKMPEWMSEGLAEYVSSPIKELLIRQAVAAGKLHSLDELEKVIGGKEQLGYSPGEVRRAYDESISVAEYLVEKHGIEKFWAYAADYAESRSLPESTQKVLGVSYVQLNQDWQSWVQKKYGRG